MDNFWIIAHRPYSWPMLIVSDPHRSDDRVSIIPVVVRFRVFSVTYDTDLLNETRTSHQAMDRRGKKVRSELEDRGWRIWSSGFWGGDISRLTIILYRYIYHTFSLEWPSYCTGTYTTHSRGIQVTDSLCLSFWPLNNKPYTLNPDWLLQRWL